MKCEICEKEMTKYAKGTYYLEDGKCFSIPFYYCYNCDTFIRKVDTVSVNSHLKSASHTAIKNEDRFYNKRINFFKYLYSIVKKYSNDKIISWLDFGCSYGHFIEFLHKKNIDSEGIEIVEQVRKHAQKNDLKIFETIDEVPESKKYNVISLIDSFYYSNEPKILMQKIYSLTSENGLIILRITNRNWLAKFRKCILKKEINLALGDATVSYSKKSITLLLKNCGYKIIGIKSIEKGKSMHVKTKLFYIMTYALYIMSIGFINICPGIIIIARKT